MGLLLDTIPDWGLSLRVVFTIFALCMVNRAASSLVVPKYQLHIRYSMLTNGPGVLVGVASDKNLPAHTR